MPEDLHVRVPGRPAGEYPVVIGEGCWGRLPQVIAEHCAAHRYALITDRRVRVLHADTVAERLRAAGLRVDVFDFPQGEANKVRETWGRISDEMLGAGLGRDSAVLAVGGGVVGDLGGFVAATFMRGVPYVQVPTTLLAMVDSSVGGKTGVDTPAGKNLIGAFHPPRAVVADLVSLQTLPTRELRAGLAEAVKHAAIADAEHFAWLESSHGALAAGDRGALEHLVLRSIQIKAGTVALDERESGRRKMLNFGHTIGHAVEALSGYRILHGEAVAIGMAAEARLGEALGVTSGGTSQRLENLLGKLRLPAGLPDDMVPEAILDLTRRDKKARRGEVEYALIEGIGKADAGPDASWGRPVPDAAVLAAVGGR